MDKDQCVGGGALSTLENNRVDGPGMKHSQRAITLGLKLGILAVAFGLAIAYFFPLRHSIDIVIEGMQCRLGEEAYSEDVVIHVQGVYSQYLIGDKDRFTGDMAISLLDVTETWRFEDEAFRNGWAPIMSKTEPDSKGEWGIDFYGDLYCTPRFDKILILVLEPRESQQKSWSTGNGLFISAPAQNRGEALDVGKLLLLTSKDKQFAERWR